MPPQQLADDAARFEVLRNSHERSHHGPVHVVSRIASATAPHQLPPLTPPRRVAFGDNHSHNDRPGTSAGATEPGSADTLDAGSSSPGASARPAAAVASTARALILDTQDTEEASHRGGGAAAAATAASEQDFSASSKSAPVVKLPARPSSAAHDAAATFLPFPPPSASGRRALNSGKAIASSPSASAVASTRAPSVSRLADITPAPPLPSLPPPRASTSGTSAAAPGGSKRAHANPDGLTPAKSLSALEAADAKGVFVSKAVMLRGPRVRAAVAAGACKGAWDRLGFGRVVYAGRAVAQLGRLLQRAKQGEVLVSGAVMQALQQEAAGGHGGDAGAAAWAADESSTHAGGEYQI